jgi:hypothetical protein
MTYYTGNLVKRPHDIHHLAHQHLEVTTDQMKAHYELVNYAGLQEGDTVWLYYPIQKRGRSPKLQT